MRRIDNRALIAAALASVIPPAKQDIRPLDKQTFTAKRQAEAAAKRKRKKGY